MSYDTISSVSLLNPAVEDFIEYGDYLELMDYSYEVNSVPQAIGKEAIESYDDFIVYSLYWICNIECSHAKVGTP